MTLEEITETFDIQEQIFERKVVYKRSTESIWTKYQKLCAAES